MDDVEHDAENRPGSSFGSGRIDGLPLTARAAEYLRVYDELRLRLDEADHRA